MRSGSEFKLERLDGLLVVEPGRQVGTPAGEDLSDNDHHFLDEIRNSKVDAVVVDFCQVDLLGSNLLGLLCNAWKLLRARSGRMVLCELPHEGQNVLKVAGLHHEWPVYRSRQEAINAQKQAVRLKAIRADTVSMFPPKPGGGPSGLRVIESGYRTVIGFNGGDYPPEHSIGRDLAEIQELIDTLGCRDFRFDMSGVESVPSGFLGLVATLSNRGVHVSVCNASRNVREVLALANFSHCLRLGSAASDGVGNAKTSEGKTAGSTKSDWMGTLFSIDRAPNTLIVSLGINGTYRSSQLHAEAAALIRKLDDPSVRHLVIDLWGANSVGSEVIGVLVGLAGKVKESGGKAAICRVSMHIHDMLGSVGLLKTCPHCPTRESAVILVNRP